MYKPILNNIQTQLAIDQINSFISERLELILNLKKVHPPLFLQTSTYLNDTLTGEEPVKFNEYYSNTDLEIVHSLAKWKRNLLYQWGFKENHGVYANMIAIRKQERLSYIHSYLVDQWDWEKVIAKDDRNVNYLRYVVQLIFTIIKDCEEYICNLYPQLTQKLPDQISFINSQDLEDIYPQLSPQQREDIIAKEKGAVFIEQVGHNLKSGVPHSLRADDYDDWRLNGDIIVYNPVHDKGIELSSMGIRVDCHALVRQSGMSEQELMNKSEFHKGIVQGTIPLSIGGGVGKSRVFMFLLEKMHIGEVQFSYWPDDIRRELISKNVHVL